MELTLIEMVAYRVGHNTDDFPMRCMACEKLTQHSEETLFSHLLGAHNFSKEELEQHADGCVYRFVDIDAVTPPVNFGPKKLTPISKEEITQ